MEEVRWKMDDVLGAGPSLQKRLFQPWKHDDAI